MVRALVVAAFALPLLAAAGARASGDAWAALAAGGQVVLLRHAETTPGAGDPPGFRLDDCSTQRNLSEAGRAQARRFGERLREKSVPLGGILSSPWCRCLDTAELAFGSRPRTHPALGNLYGRAEAREKQAQAFLALIARPPAGGNLVLVTHGSTVGALTGEYPAMGEAVVVTPLGGGRFRVVGRVTE